LAKEWWDKGQEERPIDCFVWEIPSGDEFLRIKTSATAMAFSPDGSTLAIADDHRRIHLWKLPRK
jgi:WD40 repeat protein